MTNQTKVSRDLFSTKDIEKALKDAKGSIKVAAGILSKGVGVTVSPQLLRYWVATLSTTIEEQDIGHAKALAAERKIRTQNSRLRKDVNSLVTTLGNRTEFLEAVCKTVKALNTRTDKRLPTDTSTVLEGKPLTVELLLSDLQIGKLSGSFNSDTARARLEEYGRAALMQIEQKRTLGYRVERVVLALLGDIIESDKKHKNSARATDTGTAQQLFEAMHGIFTYVIEPLAKLGVPVEVVCITGNHDHDDHGLMMYNPGKEQLSYPLYKSLEMITAKSGYQNVTFLIPEGSYAVTQFYGQGVLYEHGVGVSVTEASMKAHKTKRCEQEQEYLQYFRMGDKHTVTSFNSGQYVVNGAFFGTDKGGGEYSAIAGYSSIPAQWMGFHVPRHDSKFTLYDSFTIQLSHIKG